MVLFLLDERCVASVLEAIYKAGPFERAGTGIAFVVDVDRVVGLESQMDHFRKAAKTAK